MTLATETAEHLRQVARTVAFPPIAEIAVPATASRPCQDAEFGLVILEDGSAGAFYVWLDDTLHALGGIDLEALKGRLPADLLADVSHREIERRALGLGVMNAMTQSLFRQASFDVPNAASMGGMSFVKGDRVGMVGLFPSLSRRLHSDGVDLVVIEKREALLDDTGGLNVTLDASALEACNKVLITGSTLLNDSLAQTLTHCRHAERVAVIGPTASCLPDAVFAQGVHCFGGAKVRDLDALLHRRRSQLPWGDSVDKYLLDADSYPGVLALRAAAAR